MKLPQSRLTDPRTARITLMITIVAMVALLFALDPVAAGEATNMPIGGGGSEVYWWESSNADPLVVGLFQ